MRKRYSIYFIFELFRSDPEKEDSYLHFPVSSPMANMRRISEETFERDLPRGKDQKVNLQRSKIVAICSRGDEGARC